MTREKNGSIWTARLYASVFRGAPWNEAFKDNQGNFYGPACDLEWRSLGLNRAYPLKETAQYVRDELARPNSIYVEIPNPCNKSVVAFGWGFSYGNATEFVTEKWPSASVFNQQELINLAEEFAGNGEFWYLSEVGVNPKYQNQGLGSQIVNQLEERASRFPIIMRTNAYSPMTVIAAKCGFIQIMGYPTIRLQVDKTKTINLLDPVNPNRVLLFKPAQL